MTTIILSLARMFRMSPGVVDLLMLYCRVLSLVLGGCRSLGCLLLLKTVLLALTQVKRLVVAVQPPIRHRGVVRAGILPKGGHHEVGSEVRHAGGRPLLLLQHCLLHLGELWAGVRGEQGHTRSCTLGPMLAFYRVQRNWQG